MLGLHCCMVFSIVPASQGYSLVAQCTRFSLWWLLLWSTSSRCTGFSRCGLSSCGSWILEHRLSSVAHRLSFSEACEVFLDQGLNPSLLHWQADSLPLSHQGSSCLFSTLSDGSHLYWELSSYIRSCWLPSSFCFTSPQRSFISHSLKERRKRKIWRRHST